MTDNTQDTIHNTKQTMQNHQNKLPWFSGLIQHSGKRLL